MNKIVLFLAISGATLSLQAQADTLAAQAKAGQPINVGSISFIEELPLPSGVKKFLNRLSITKPTTSQQPVKRDPTSAESPIDNAFIISGEAIIDSIKTEVKVRILTLAEGGKKYTISVGLPSGIRLSQIDSKLGAFDIIQFTKAAFIFSQDTYKDPEWGVTIKPGFNLITGIQVGGEIEKLTKALGKNVNQLIAQGVITPAITGSSISVQLPGTVSLGKIGNTTGLVLSLAITEATPGVPSLDISVRTGLNIHIPSQTAPIILTGEIRAKAAPPKLYLSGWMEGYYENAFAINGLRLGQFGLSADIDLTVATASGGLLAFSGFCLGGSTGFGQKLISLNGCIDFSASPDILLLSDIQGGLYLKDLVSFALDLIKRATGKDISSVAQKLPELGFQKFKVYIVPKDTLYQGKTYKKGVEVEVIADIVKTPVELAIRVDDTGINGLGYVPDFSIGPVKVTGTGKAGLTGKGAVVQLQVDAQKLLASLFVDGTVEIDILGGIKAGTVIDLSNKGLSFAVDTNIFNEFAATIKINAKGSVSAATTAPEEGDLTQEKNYAVYAKLQQSALKKWSGACIQASRDMVANAKGTLAEKQANVESLNSKIADLDKQIAARQAEVQALIAKAQQLLAPLDETRRDLDAAIERCKAKAPQFVSQLTQIAGFGSVTPDQLKAALNSLESTVPNIPSSIVSTIEQTASKVQ